MSRRTVERMIDRGQLQRDTRHDGRIAMVTKRSLVQMLEAQRRDNPTRPPRPVSQPSLELAGALEAIASLTDALKDERRQLTAASEERRAAEREREEARIEAARLQAELAAYRQASDADQNALRTQLEEIANAGPIRAMRLRRQLRQKLEQSA